MYQNSMMVIKPYKWEGIWVFDDDKTGLVREPFVAGVPEILEALLHKQNIPSEEAEKGFRLYFFGDSVPRSPVVRQASRGRSGRHVV